MAESAYEWPPADWMEKVIQVAEVLNDMNDDITLRNTDAYIEFYNLPIEWWMETAIEGWAGVTDADC